VGSGNADIGPALISKASMERPYRNLGYIFLVLPPILLSGFWIPYFSLIPRFDPSITTAVQIHAILLFAWVGLLVIQPLAIRMKAISAHRVLGKASYFLLPLIVVSSIGMLFKEYQENVASGTNVASAVEAEYLSATQLILIAIFYGSAIVRVRVRDIAEHMGYMICIALALLPAGLARTLGYWFHVRLASSQTICFAVIDLCLISLLVVDRYRRSSAQPYVVAMAAYLVVEAGWLALGRPV
jgi:hypothetical protein